MLQCVRKMQLFQYNFLDADRLVEEGGCRFAELLFGLCRAIPAISSAGASGIHFGMPVEVVLQTFGHQFALCDNVNVSRHVLAYFGQ